MSELQKSNFHHPLTENREISIVSFSDSFVTHSFDFLTHPNWSIEHMRQIVETAFLNEGRKEDGLFPMCPKCKGEI